MSHIKLRSSSANWRALGRSSLLGLLLLASWTTVEISAQESASEPVREERTEQQAENQVHYEIKARLEDGTHILHAEETIDWTNGSSDTVQDLWFHTYLNAFANTASTHLTESGGKLRGVDAESGWGWMRIERISLVDAADSASSEEITGTLLWRAPDDDNEADRTVFSVDLPRSVAPGETIRVHVEWESQLPRVRRRTGYKDDFILAAQWFPKLGVYQGGKGWNCHQFHASTEFFSDYGTYEVSLDLPKRYEGKVMATGVKTLERPVPEGRVTVTFKAPSDEDRAMLDRTGKQPRVHDFTWTADPNYLVKEFTFVYSDWKKRFPEEVNLVQGALGTEKDISLRDVHITVMIHPEREGQAQRHADATAAALFFYGLWFGEYPYEHITVVDPAWGAGGAGGMEYPTLFTCGTRLGNEVDMGKPEGVTVHECGHQFWYALVGNNEFESAWLDEGFNSYTDSEVLWRTYGATRAATWYSKLPVYGKPMAPLTGGGKVLQAISGRRLTAPSWIPFLGDKSIQPLAGSGMLDWWREQPMLSLASELSDPRWGDRSGYLRDAWVDKVDTPAWEYVDRNSYRTNSYPRPAVILRSLEGLVDRGVFLRGMRNYSEKWRYRHPEPDDFFEAFNEGAEVDVNWFFDELFRGHGTVDWSVEISSKAQETPEGVFQDETGHWGLPEEDLEEAVGRRAEIIVRREGELRLPLDIRVTFENGEVEERVWTREAQQDGRWMSLEFEGTSKVISVELDPDHKWYLDGDMSNNQWFREEGKVAPLRWSERVFSRFVHAFHWQMGIGG